jgi:hypothetical protein
MTLTQAEIKKFGSHIDHLISSESSYDPTPVLIYVAEISKMRKAGLPKPPDCSWGDYLVPKLNFRHRTAAMLLSRCYLPSEVRRNLKFSPSRWAVLMSSSLFKLQLNHYQGKVWHDPSKMFSIEDNNRFGLKTV